MSSEPWSSQLTRETKGTMYPAPRCSRFIAGVGLHPRGLPPHFAKTQSALANQPRRDKPRRFNVRSCLNSPRSLPQVFTTNFNTHTRTWHPPRHPPVRANRHVDRATSLPAIWACIELQLAVRSDCLVAMSASKVVLSESTRWVRKLQ